jgi:NAD(P)-dependent dehydrogenase (short-subunit alcohol dehydrogenase family)
MKNVLITGASGGIGLAAVQIFLEKGWRVVAAVRPGREASLPERNHLCVVGMDVCNRAGVAAIVRRVLEETGGIDVLVNNAGVYATGPLEESGEDEVSRVLETNLGGVIRTTRALLPHFRERRSGTIVNVSSIAGRTAFPYQSLYHASKWALEGLSESLAQEVAPFGIRVKLVEPGMVRTDLYRNVAAASGIPHGAYALNFDAWKRYLLGNLATGRSPEISARAIFRAATDPAPRLRYPSGADARAGMMLRTLLTYRGFAGVVRRFAGQKACL